jgi:hypothetical protein
MKTPKTPPKTLKEYAEAAAGRLKKLPSGQQQQNKENVKSSKQPRFVGTKNHRNGHR